MFTTAIATAPAGLLQAILLRTGTRCRASSCIGSVDQTGRVMNLAQGGGGGDKIFWGVL
jgi:hypothetical protein